MYRNTVINMYLHIVNMYKNKDGISWIGPEYFKSKEEAEKEGKTRTCSVTTIKIEWEE